MADLDLSASLNLLNLLISFSAFLSPALALSFRSIAPKLLGSCFVKAYRRGGALPGGGSLRSLTRRDLAAGRSNLNRQRRQAMSRRGTEFLDGWAKANLHSGTVEKPGELAERCTWEALEAGIPKEELEEEFGNIERYFEMAVTDEAAIRSEAEPS